MAQREPGYEKALAEKVGAAREAAKQLTSGGLHPEWRPERVTAVLLVGSVGRGLARERSDVDLLVLTDGSPSLTQKDLRPLLQNVADRHGAVPYIDPRVVSEESFRKSLRNPLTDGRLALRRMLELKRLVPKSGEGKLQRVLERMYPAMQRMGKGVGVAIDDRHTESHTAEEQLMSMVMYERSPGAVEGMFREAGLRPEGLFQFRGFEAVLDSYLSGGRSAAETRRLLQGKAPYMWKAHLSALAPTYGNAGDRAMLERLAGQRTKPMQRVRSALGKGAARVRKLARTR